LRIQGGVGKTMIFVTHDVEEALKLGDQIAVLSEGRLIQFGAPGELIMAPANDFVRRLIGADNILRQFDYLSVVVALEPVSAPSSARIGSGATLMRALLMLIETGQNTLTVEDDGNVLGQVSLASMYRALDKAGALSTTTATGKASPQATSVAQ
ncbi:MAG TPA: hypothetical protein VKQ36_13820, partial [Ktedonobacterales bacterium]|nr:hypothetical protein [Ktedonobacterales bacterium]